MRKSKLILSAFAVLQLACFTSGVQAQTTQRKKQPIKVVAKPSIANVKPLQNMLDTLDVLARVNGWKSTHTSKKLNVALIPESESASYLIAFNTDEVANDTLRYAAGQEMISWPPRLGASRRSVDFYKWMMKKEASGEVWVLYDPGNYGS